MFLKILSSLDCAVFEIFDKLALDFSKIGVLFRSQGTKDYLNQELLTPRCEIVIKVNKIGLKRLRIILNNNY